MRYIIVHTRHLNLLLIIIIRGWRTRWGARPSGCWSWWAAIVLVIFFPLLKAQFKVGKCGRRRDLQVCNHYFFPSLGEVSAQWMNVFLVTVSFKSPCLRILLSPLGCWGGGGGGGGGESWSCPCGRSAVPYTATVRVVYQPRNTRPSVFTCMNKSI